MADERLKRQESQQSLSRQSPSQQPRPLGQEQPLEGGVVGGVAPRDPHHLVGGDGPDVEELDGSEFLDVRTVPADEVMGVARSDAANDATLEGLLLAERAGLL